MGPVKHTAKIFILNCIIIYIYIYIKLPLCIIVFPYILIPYIKIILWVSATL